MPRSPGSRRWTAAAPNPSTAVRRAISDFQSLDHALVDKGLSRPEIDALLDGKTPQPPIPDATMCEAGQSYLATLATLPASVRTRLYGLAVDLMAKS